MLYVVQDLGLTIVMSPDPNALSGRGYVRDFHALVAAVLTAMNTQGADRHQGMVIAKASWLPISAGTDKREVSVSGPTHR